MIMFSIWTKRASSFKLPGFLPCLFDRRRGNLRSSEKGYSFHRGCSIKKKKPSLDEAFPRPWGIFGLYVWQGMAKEVKKKD